MFSMFLCHLQAKGHRTMLPLSNCVVGNYALAAGSHVPSLGLLHECPPELPAAFELGLPLGVAPPFTTTPPSQRTARCNAATLHADTGSTRRDPRAPAATGYTSQQDAPTGDHGPVGIRWGRRLVRDKDGSLKAARSTKATQVQVHRGTVLP